MFLHCFLNMSNNCGQFLFSYLFHFGGNFLSSMKCGDEGDVVAFLETIFSLTEQLPIGVVNLKKKLSIIGCSLTSNWSQL